MLASKQGHSRVCQLGVVDIHHGMEVVGRAVVVGETQVDQVVLSQYDWVVDHGLGVVVVVVVVVHHGWLVCAGE